MGARGVGRRGHRGRLLGGPFREVGLGAGRRGGLEAAVPSQGVRRAGGLGGRSAAGRPAGARFSGAPTEVLGAERRGGRRGELKEARRALFPGAALLEGVLGGVHLGAGPLGGRREVLRVGHQMAARGGVRQVGVLEGVRGAHRLGEHLLVEVLSVGAHGEGLQLLVRQEVAPEVEVLVEAHSC